MFLCENHLIIFFLQKDSLDSYVVYNQIPSSYAQEKADSSTWLSAPTRLWGRLTSMVSNFMASLGLRRRSNDSDLYNYPIARSDSPPYYNHQRRKGIRPPSYGGGNRYPSNRRRKNVMSSQKRISSVPWFEKKKEDEKTTFKVVHLPKEGSQDQTSSSSSAAVKTGGAAKIHSREPVVAIYSDQGAVRETMKSKPQKKPSSFKKFFSPKKNFDSFVVSTSFSHEAKDVPGKNSMSVGGGPNLVAPHDRYRSGSALAPTRADTMRPFFLTPPLQGGSHAQPPKKTKTLFDNVSSFASNLFQKMRPKKQQGPIYTSPSRRTRGGPSVPQNPYRLYPGHPQHQVASASSPQIALTKSINPFDASPKEGSMAADAFQPLFDPSPSLDEELPYDIMKPMPSSVVQKRETAAKGPTKPQLMNFFQ